MAKNGRKSWREINSNESSETISHQFAAFQNLEIILSLLAYSQAGAKKPFSVLGLQIASL